MATISAFNNFRLDFLNPETMGSLMMTGAPVITPTKIIVQTVSGLLTIEGHDLSVDVLRETASGTVTGASLSVNGQLVASASGLAIGVEPFIVLMTTPHSPASIAIEEFMLSGDDTITGSGGNDVVRLGAGNDRVEGGAGNDYVLGGSGVDTAIHRSSRADYSIEIRDGTTTVKKGLEVDTYLSVERIQFSDGLLATDIGGNAGQAYRLYQAAFDRTPDKVGLGYWMRELDAGKGDLAWMANNFLISDEFKATYGSPETVSNSAFLTLIYANVLDRNPDADGFNYWMGELNNGFARERVLASFSESTENQANVAAAIHDGIWFG